MNFEQAWRQNDLVQYVWITSPQRLVHNYKSQYETIQETFAEKTLPDRDRIIKKKLLQGFPRKSREWLENIMDSNIPLSRFVEHVEIERTIFLKSGVKVDAKPNPSSQPMSKTQHEA